jgi:hypothetical protein
MSNYIKLFLTFLSPLLFISACQTTAPREEVGAIAKHVVGDVGKIMQTSPGKKGAPILIIEENHLSKAVRIEEAIILNRLRNDHNVTQIGLEGSIKEGSPVNAQWFFQAAKNQPEASTPVAVNLLREGEINSAEFMEMAYDNINPVPIETIKEYAVEVDETGAHIVYIQYLFKLALESPRPEQEAKLRKMLDETKAIKDPAELEKKRESVFKYIYSLKPTELSNDPLVKELSDKLIASNTTSHMSLREEVNFYENMQKRIEEKFGKLEPEEQKLVDGFLRFLRAREAANTTMVDATAIVADRSDVSAVAMIIGAAHTQGVAALFKQADRPFAVIRPNSLDLENDPSLLSNEMFENKIKGTSVYSGDITEAILKAYPLNNRLPPPVLQQRWFTAKSELYLYTERITQKYLSGGGAGKPPTGGGEPPLFASGDFDGSYIRIDPTKIKVVKDEASSKANVVVFPIEINPNDASRAKTLWVKAGRSNEGLPPVREKEGVEKMLKEALEDVKTEKKIPEPDPSGQTRTSKETLPKLEGEGGRIKITRETTAAFADSEAAVMKKSVVVRS